MGNQIFSKAPELDLRYVDMGRPAQLNSKFYVSGIKRLGISELALSDGPHGVRAEINRNEWAYSGWTTDSTTCFPPGQPLPQPGTLSWP